MIGLLVIAGINTVISLIYYLRVAKIVWIDPEPENSRPGLARPVAGGVCAGRGDSRCCIYGILPGRVLEIAHQATQQLFM